MLESGTNPDILLTCCLKLVFALFPVLLVSLCVMLFTHAAGLYKNFFESDCPPLITISTVDTRFDVVVFFWLWLWARMVDVELMTVSLFSLRLLQVSYLVWLSISLNIP